MAMSVGVVLLAVDIIELPGGDSQERIQEENRPPVVVKVSSDLLFTGNTFWGRRINDWAMASPLKYSYPFSHLAELDRNKYNAWITGIECPLVPGVQSTAYQEDVILQFNCSPEYLAEASKWFNIITLANNHTDNQGISGFKKTKQQLDKNSMQYFGHYDPRAIEDLCEVISLPVTVGYDDGAAKQGKLPVAMCGYHGVFRLPLADAVDVMSKYSKYMPVFALPHMGAEYKSAPDQLKTDFYRSLINGGADVVLGDHPHWIQTTESYKGHLIVYSMGNFMFDQQGELEITRSAAIKVKIESEGNSADLLEKWMAIGEQCATFKDDCLEQIKTQDLPKLELTYQFGVVGTDSSNKITRLASKEKQVDILRRLNWQSTMSQLRYPYSKL